jgi:hypothetical protein
MVSGHKYILETEPGLQNSMPQISWCLEATHVEGYQRNWIP